MKYNDISNNPRERSLVTHPWVYYDNCFTNAEINSIVRYCDSFEQEQGVTFGAESREQIEQHRVSSVKFHERNNETAWIFDKINVMIESMNKQYYGFDLNGYLSFQYTTYTAEEKGRYDWHTDMSFGKAYGDDVEPRKLSMTLLLNEDFEGGEFQINMSKEDSPEIVHVPKGRAIFFPSFMIHRVTPVTRGIRKSMVVWVLGPKFR
jgi:PKHD-type hydroxylase